MSSSYDEKEREDGKKRLFACVSIREQRRSTEKQLTGVSFKVLNEQMRWLRSELDAMGYEMRSPLDWIPNDLTWQQKALMAENPEWERRSEPEMKDEILNADLVGYIPSLRGYSENSLGQRLLDFAESAHKEIAKVEDTTGDGETATREMLRRIESAIVNPHLKKTVIMKGGKHL